MNILYFTDTHIRGTSPKNRLDDFVESLENKFKEINNIIIDEDIDFVLHGGDLFERPDTSLSVINRFTKLLNEIKVPIYLISGNHDIYGQNPNTINRTILSLLDTLQLLTLVEAGDTYFLEKDTIKVQLTGQPYVYNMDATDKPLDFYSPKEIHGSSDYSIHMVHGMLLDKPFIKGIDYTLIDDIKNTKADITLSGHYHRGFNTVELDGKLFINPGSLVRISNSTMELKRRPKVVIITITDAGVSYRDIYLKSPKAGEEVLDRRALEEAHFKNERLLEFKQTIDSALDFEKMDIYEVILDFSNTEKIEKDVSDEALRRIAEIEMEGLKL